VPPTARRAPGGARHVLPNAPDRVEVEGYIAELEAAQRERPPQPTVTRRTDDGFSPMLPDPHTLTFGGAR
jgi:hypothetical protein